MPNRLYNLLQNKGPGTSARQLTNRLTSPKSRVNNVNSSANTNTDSARNQNNMGGSNTSFNSPLSTHPQQQQNSRRRPISRNLIDNPSPILNLFKSSIQNSSTSPTNLHRVLNRPISTRILSQIPMARSRHKHARIHRYLRNPRGINHVSTIHRNLINYNLSRQTIRRQVTMKRPSLSSISTVLRRHKRSHSHVRPNQRTHQRMPSRRYPILNINNNRSLLGPTRASPDPGCTTTITASLSPHPSVLVAVLTSNPEY